MSNIYDLEKILYERNPEFKLIMTECEDAVVEREIAGIPQNYLVTVGK